MNKSSFILRFFKDQGFRTYILFMWSYIRDYKLKIWILLVFILIFTLAGRLFPITVGWAVDYGIKGQDISYIYWCGGLLFLCGLTSAVMFFQISYGFRAIGQKTVYRIRQDLIRHVQRINISYFDKTPSGKTVTRIANDTRALGDLFSAGLSGAFISFIEVLSIVVSLFILSWPMALAVMIIAPPVFWSIVVLTKKIRQQLIKIKSKLSSINAYSAESFNGIQVLQLYNKEAQALDHFQKEVVDYRDLSIKGIHFYALLWPLIEFFQFFSIIVSLGLGLYLSNQELISIGQITAFILLLQSFFDPLRTILEKYQQVQNGITSSQRVIELFEEPSEDFQTKEGPLNEKFKQKLAIECRSLGFWYKDSSVKALKNISLTIASQSKNALVGYTGSGKTTLAALFQGFYKPCEGELRIYGKDIQSYSMEELRKKILVVRQEEFIFKGTVFSNVILGNPSASKKEVLNAITQMGLDLSLEHSVDQMGSNLSAGERQLIALARVVLFNPDIIILDEATSHIDKASEQKVLMAMNKVLAGKTSIVIAHRLATVLGSDQIFVLEEGEIIERGHPKELLLDRDDSHLYKFYDQLL